MCAKRRGPLKRFETHYPLSRTGRAACVATLALFAWIGLGPVVVAFAQSFWTDGGLSLSAYTSVLGEARQWGLLLRSLSIALGAAAWATVLGAPMGFALERSAPPGKPWLWCVVSIPFLMPTPISAMAWIDLLGANGWAARLFAPAGALAADRWLTIYSALGCVWVYGLAGYPIVAVTTCAALRQIDPRVEEAGRVAASPARVFLNVTAPLIAPVALTGSLLVFVITLIDFPTASLLQVNVYPVEIHRLFSVGAGLGAVTAQATPLVLVGGGAYFLWNRCWAGRNGWSRGDGCPTRAVQTRRARWRRWFGGAVCWGGALLVAGAPLSVLFVRSLSFGSWRSALQSSWNEIGVSLIVSTAAASSLTAMAFAMALVARRIPWTGLFFGATVIAFLVSGPVIGVGMIALYNNPLLGGVYDGIGIMILAIMARYLLIAWKPVWAMISALAPALDESAAACGAGPLRRILGITLPLALPGLLTVWGLCFVLAMRELSAVILVYPPGAAPLSVRLFSLMHYGPSRDVAALSVAMTAIILVSAAMAAAGVVWLRRRWGAWNEPTGPISRIDKDKP